MTETEGRPAIGRSGVAGDARKTGEKPPPGGRDRPDASSAEGPPAIDLDTARDRAS
ncbi:MAG: hypothetical protein ACXW27_16040 [Allosphingosinicella sp.]